MPARKLWFIIALILFLLVGGIATGLGFIWLKNKEDVKTNGQVEQTFENKVPPSVTVERNTDGFKEMKGGIFSLIVNLPVSVVKLGDITPGAVTQATLGYAIENNDGTTTDVNFSVSGTQCVFTNSLDALVVIGNVLIDFEDTESIVRFRMVDGKLVPGPGFDFSSLAVGDQYSPIFLGLEESTENWDFSKQTSICKNLWESLTPASEDPLFYDKIYKFLTTGDPSDLPTNEKGIVDLTNYLFLARLDPLSSD